MIEIYNRIILGKPYGKNLNPYSETKLRSVLNYLENDDDFEKCIILKSIIDKRFTHGYDYFNSRVNK